MFEAYVEQLLAPMLSAAQVVILHIRGVHKWERVGWLVEAMGPVLDVVTLRNPKGRSTTVAIRVLARLRTAVRYDHRLPDASDSRKALFETQNRRLEEPEGEASYTNRHGKIDRDGHKIARSVQKAKVGRRGGDVRQDDRVQNVDAVRYLTDVGEGPRAEDKARRVGPSDEVGDDDGGGKGGEYDLVILSCGKGGGKGHVAQLRPPEEQQKCRTQEV